MKKTMVLLMSFIMILAFSTELVASAQIISWKELSVKDKVDIVGGSIDLKELEIDIKDVIGFDILRDNKRENIYFYINGYKVNFNSELKLNTKYNLRVITNKDKYNIEFITNDLPDITRTGKVIVVRVPAIPEKGFMWPYYLRIPSDTNVEFNNNKKNYLMIDMVNLSGKQPGIERLIDKYMKESRSIAIGTAEGLNLPIIIPAIPRTNSYYNIIKYTSTGQIIEDENMTYEHALDRDMIYLKELLADKNIGEELRTSYSDNGYNADDFIDIDKQVLAMIDHAIAYLNKYNHKVENKVMWNGFSASGEFAQRFTVLYPHRVKAMVSGGAMEGTMIPLETYKGEQLIYPIGVYDYEKITGRKFNLSEYNNVAKLAYMGKMDDNDTLFYNDCYGNRERDIMIKLYGTALHDRIREIKKIYKTAGGKGAFVYVKDVGHSGSMEILEYIIQFFKDNMDSIEPVYKLPTDNKIKSQLEIEIFN